MRKWDKNKSDHDFIYDDLKRRIDDINDRFNSLKVRGTYVNLFTLLNAIVEYLNVEVVRQDPIVVRKVKK